MMRRQFSPEELCAAYLADPLRIPRQVLPWNACDVQAVLKVLQSNKVPLLSLADLEESRDLHSTSLFRAACHAEERELKALRAEYQIVKEALIAEGIEDVLIKSVGLPPSFPYKSDNLDVLYKPEDIERVKATLGKLGYVELKNVEEPLKYLFRKFHAGRSVSAIHVHGHVGWMVSFLDEEALWKRCRVSDDDTLVTIPSAEDALLTTLAHYFYEDKRVSLLDVLKYAHCLRQGVDWDEVYRIATWRGWRDGLNVSLLLCAYQERALYGETLVPLSILRRAIQMLPAWTRVLLQRFLGLDVLTVLCSKEWRGGTGIKELPLRIPFVFSKLFFYTKLVRDPTRGTKRKLKDLAVHTGNGTKLRLNIHSQPAMLVTFSGVDGCGKTTQAKALQSALKTCHLKSNYVWSRGGSSSLVQLLSRFSRGTTRYASHESVATKVRSRQQRFRSRWVRWGWSWLTTVELLWQYVCHVLLPLLRGRVVVCDRYIYDTLAEWAAYFSEAHVEKRLAARVLRMISPRPRVAYWLKISPETAQLRSADGTPKDFVATQSAAYRHLAQLYGLQVLDAEKAWEDLSDEIVYQVLRAYFANYHTLINSLFLKNPGQWM